MFQADGPLPIRRASPLIAPNKLSKQPRRHSLLTTSRLRNQHFTGIALMGKLLEFKKSNNTRDFDIETRLERMREAGESLDDWYHERFCEIFDAHGLGDGHAPAPLEVFAGIAQSLSDASGYRVALQEMEFEPIAGQPDTSRAIGFHDVAT